MSDFDNNNQQGGGGDRPAFDPSKLGPIEDMKLRLYAAPAMGGTKRPSLSFKMFENNPRITVKTNVEGDKDHGKMVVSFDMPVWFFFLEAVRDIIDSPAPTEGNEPITHRIVNKKRKFINNESKILDDTYILIGKDPDGLIWISVLAYDKDRPRIKFEFLPGDYHSIVGKDRQPYPKGKLSHFMARGWLEMLQKLIPMLFVRDYQYVDYFAKKDRQGNRLPSTYGNGGGGGGQGGGYNNQNRGNGGGGGGGNNYGNNNGGGNNYGNQNRSQGGGGGGSYQGNNSNGGAAKSAPPSDNWADDDDLVI